MFYLQEKLSKDEFNSLRKLSYEEKLEKLYINLDIDKLTPLKNAITNSDVGSIKEFISDKKKFLTLAEQISLYIYFYHIEGNRKAELDIIIPDLLGEIKKSCSLVGNKRINTKKLLNIELIKFFNEILNYGVNQITLPVLRNIIDTNNFKISEDILKSSKLIDQEISTFNNFYNYISLSRRPSEKYLEDLASLVSNKMLSISQQYHILKLFILLTEQRNKEFIFLKEYVFTLVKDEYLLVLEQKYKDSSSELTSLINSFMHDEFDKIFRIDQKTKLSSLREVLVSKSEVLLDLHRTELEYHDQMLLVYYFSFIDHGVDSINDAISYLSFIPNEELEYIKNTQDMNQKKFLAINFFRKEIAGGRLDSKFFFELVISQKIALKDSVYRSIIYYTEDQTNVINDKSLIFQIRALSKVRDYNENQRHDLLGLIPHKYIDLVIQQSNPNIIIEAIKNSYLSNNLDKLDFLFEKDSHLPVMYELKTDGIYLSDNILIGFGVMQILDFAGPYIPVKYFPSTPMSKSLILSSLYAITSVLQLQFFPYNFQSQAKLHLAVHSAIFSARLVTLELFNQYDSPPETMKELPKYCMNRSGMINLPSLIGIGFLTYYSAKTNPLAKLIPIVISQSVNIGVGVSYCYNNYKFMANNHEKYLFDQVAALTIDFLAFVTINKYTPLAFSSVGTSVYSVSNIISNGIMVYSIVDPIVRFIGGYIPENIKEYGDSLLSGINLDYFEDFSISNLIGY